MESTEDQNVADAEKCSTKTVTMDIYKYTINAFDATTVSDVVCSSSLCIMCVFSRCYVLCGSILTGSHDVIGTDMRVPDYTAVLVHFLIRFWAEFFMFMLFSIKT